MAIAVEDGTGVTGANSYVSQVDASAYFTGRGGAAEWTAASSTQKDGALLVAATWLDGMYRWLGLPKTRTQGLAWPRTGVWDAPRQRSYEGAIPQPLIDAQCEVALMHLRSPLNATLKRGGQIQSVSVEGAVSVTYAPGAPAEAVLGILAPLLRGLHAGRIGVGGKDTRR